VSFAKPDAAMGLVQRIKFVDLTTEFVSWVPDFVKLEMICVIRQARCCDGERIKFVDITTEFVSWVPDFVKLEMICVIRQARCWGGAPRRFLQCACCACACVCVCMCVCVYVHAHVCLCVCLVIFPHNTLLFCPLPCISKFVYFRVYDHNVCPSAANCRRGTES